MKLRPDWELLPSHSIHCLPPTQRSHDRTPLPSPQTYTEFILRAKRARMPDKLDFLYVSPEAPKPPRIGELTPSAAPQRAARAVSASD